MKASKVFGILVALVISVTSTTTSHAITSERIEIASVADICVDLNAKCDPFLQCLGMMLFACCQEAGGTIEKIEGGRGVACFGDRGVEARYLACSKNDIEFCSQLLEGQ